MDNNIDLSLFFVSEKDSYQTDELMDNYSNVIFESFKTAKEILAHIHLNPDFIFVINPLIDCVLQDFIEKVQELNARSKIIYVTENTDLKEAVVLLKSGVEDYIDYNSFTNDYIIELIDNFYKTYNFNFKKNKIDIVDKFRELGFYGSGRVMRKLYRIIEDSSKFDSTVLISGETGSEFELVAETIHKLSKRQNGIFNSFDVLAYPFDMLEFELFGREKDTFAGILKRKTGIIEASSGGTLYINNIEQMPLVLQSRFYRALKEKKFIKPGGQNIVFFNARLMVASSVNLEKEVKDGNLRADLYQYLSAVIIEIPPLRKRAQDIIFTANILLREFSRRNKLKLFTLLPAARDTLLNYAYPGNLQELKKIIEVSALFANGPDLDKEDLILQQKTVFEHLYTEEFTLDEYIEKIILFFLDKYNNDVLLVAKKLDIGKSTIYRLLQKRKLSQIIN
jgi:DNA-binding NtrC family response regulator